MAEATGPIDKRYDAWITPLRAERFQRVHRHTPAEGEPLATGDHPGLSLPPRVTDVDIQIEELKRKQAQEKQTLIEQALRSGALPGVVSIIRTPPVGMAQPREAMAKTEGPLRPQATSGFF